MTVEEYWKKCPFKEGQTVKLKATTRSYNASDGTLAVVCSPIDIKFDLINIKWDLKSAPPNKKMNAGLKTRWQMDGAYPWADFVVVADTGPKNNDSRSSCFWCGEPTKKVNTGFTFYDVCSKCGK